MGQVSSVVLCARVSAVVVYNLRDRKCPSQVLVSGEIGSSKRDSCDLNST